MIKGLDSLRGMGTKYFKESLFRVKKVKPTIHYSENSLQIAKDLETGEIYRLDLTDGRKIFIAGLSGCMPKGTLVKVPEGFKPIEECSNVLSYNFDKHQIQNKKCKVHPSGKKKVVKIKTSKGVIICSPEHKWFVIREGKRIVIQTKELLKTDKLLRCFYGENS